MYITEFCIIVKECKATKKYLSKLQYILGSMQKNQCLQIILMTWEDAVDTEYIIIKL